jgi:hypothetical protein
VAAVTAPEYAEDDLVEVRYPATAQGQANRPDWPWRPAVIISEVGPDEWLVEVTDDALAALDGGELVYPTCYRDGHEIRTRS